MFLTWYFVEFIFYSFLGWVWESIYCTINEKKWADRGFLFGPVCPIYGGCVIAVSLIFGLVPLFADPSFPIWAIFIICCIGSAIAEFGTSWVLEKRFHARWWDYSDMPLNIQGRICLPVSLLFGAAGVVVVKFLLPWVDGLHAVVSPLIYEILGLGFAMIFGADFALTEASLSELLKNVESMHEEYVAKAQQNYEKIVATQSAFGERVRSEVSTIEEKLSKEKEFRKEQLAASRQRLAELHVKKLSYNQKRILENIQKFTSDKNKTQEQNESKMDLLAKLKESISKSHLKDEG